MQHSRRYHNARSSIGQKGQKGQTGTTNNTGLFFFLNNQLRNRKKKFIFQIDFDMLCSSQVDKQLEISQRELDIKEKTLEIKEKKLKIMEELLNIKKRKLEINEEMLRIEKGRQGMCNDMKNEEYLNIEYL